MNDHDLHDILEIVENLGSQFERWEEAWLNGSEGALPKMKEALPRVDFYLQRLRSVKFPAEDVQEAIMLLPEQARLAINLCMSPEERLEFYQHVLNDAERFGFQTAEAIYGYQIGNAYMDLGLAKEACILLERALQVYEQVEELRGEVPLVLSDLGICLCELGDLKRARVVVLQAIDGLAELGDTDAVAVTTASLGTIQYQQGDLQDARNTLLRAETLQETANLLTELGSTRGNLAVVFHELGQHAVALRYATRSLEQARQDGNMNEIATRLLTHAAITRGLGDIDSAIEIADEACRIATEFHFALTHCYALIELAESRFEQEQPEATNQLLQDAEAIAMGGQYRAALASVRSSRARVLTEMGKPAEAMPFLESARQLFAEIGDASGGANADFYSAVACYALGDQAKAQEYVGAAFRTHRALSCYKADEVLNWAMEALNLREADL